MPLHVLVTRPEPQASQWAHDLAHDLANDRMRGPHGRPIRTHALPLIAISAPADASPVEQLWQGMADQALLMFVSPAAVAWFFRLKPAGARWPAHTLCAAPGPGTARAVVAAGAAHGLAAEQVISPGADAEQFDSEALWPLLAPLDWHGRRVAIVSGGDDNEAKGRTWLAEQWRTRGAQVASVLTYQRGPGQWGADQQALARQALQQPDHHLWLLSSSQAIDFLVQHHLPALHLPTTPDWGAMRALVTHPKIAERARSLGIHRLTATRPTLAAVVEALRTAA